jgi:class 3 adenylate cyclase/pimeloyl-ACP methyl ester carboxylesterase
MEPRIQYAKTSDGVNIAYCSLGQGSGPALVQVFGLTVPTHFRMEWQIPAARAWYERLCLNRRLILFDLRGSGSSQRDVTDYSLDAMVRDVEAVTGRLSLDRFALCGQYLGAATAIVYATRHPERVSHLITWDGCAKIPNFPALRPSSYSILTLMRDDWEMFTEVYSHQAFGWPEGEVARSYAALTRQAITRDALARQFAAAWQFDATALLPQVKAPALVMRRAGASDAGDTVAQTLASGIPDSRVLVFQGSGVAYPFLGDSGPVADAIDAFLSEGRELSPASTGMTAILFADIADSTALTERLGDAAFRAKARELGPVLRALVRECAGAPVEGPTLGDGVLAVFTSAREAIEAALRCAAAGDSAGLPLHLGLHAGDVTREEDPDGRDNVYGGAVNIAARISGLSAPGEVLVSETVRSLARTSAGVRFEDRGEQPLKGVGEAVRVWAVEAGETS